MTPRKYVQYRTAQFEHVNVQDLLADAELSAIEYQNAKANNGHLRAGLRFCKCDETRIRGKRFALHNKADCDYCSRRTELISEACKMANQCVNGSVVGNKELSYRWTAAFVAAMERLSYNAGLLR